MRRFICTRGEWQWDEQSQLYLKRRKEGYWYDGPIAKGMDTPTMRQFHFQWFNDDGSDETDSTTKAAIDTDITGQAADVNILIRFVVDETAGNANDNYSPQIQRRVNLGTFVDCSAVSTIVHASPSTKLVDGDDTTQRVGSGTFITLNSGQDDQNCKAGGQTPDYVGNDEAEFVYCIQLIGADLNNDDEIDIRISDTNIDTYGVAHARVKVSIAGGPAVLPPRNLSALQAVARMGHY